MSAARQTVYAAHVAAVEPHGLERIDERERHGTPRDLFSLWFAANAETATFATGILTVALYGTSFWGAAAGILIGNLLGYAVLGVLSQAGPKFGRPQMVVSRLAFGADANTFPAVLSFLAGVGWFAINTVFGAFAVQALFRVPYLPALAIVLAVEIVIAIYGHNMIHLFEKVAGIALTVGFVAIAIACFQRAHPWAPFDPHAPLAAGGEAAGIVYSAAIAFSYAIGWAPAASDYSRYLPAASSRGSVWWWTFLGGALPSTALEILGAAAVTAIAGGNLVSATPSEIIAKLFASGPLVALGLVTVTLGTLSANCLNLYSGALSALAAWDRDRRGWFAVLTGAAFGLSTYAIFAVAAATDPSGRFPAASVLGTCLAIGLLSAVVVRFTLARWQAALIVGLLGGALALTGTQPEKTAANYTNFLLLLSTWAAPWAGAVIAGRAGHARRLSAAAAGWLAGLLISLPFVRQEWFVGPLAARMPQIGDVSYFLGFAAAFAVAWLLRRGAPPLGSSTTEAA